MEKTDPTIIVIPANWEEKVVNEMNKAEGDMTTIAVPSVNGNRRAYATWLYILLKNGFNIDPEHERKNINELDDVFSKYYFIFVGGNRGEGKTSGSQVVSDSFLLFVADYLFRLILRSDFNRDGIEFKEVGSWIKWKNKNIQSSSAQLVIEKLTKLSERILISANSNTTLGNIQTDLKDRIRNLSSIEDLSIKIISNEFHNIVGRIEDLFATLGEDYKIEFISAESIINYSTKFDPDLQTYWDIAKPNKRRLPFGLEYANESERNEAIGIGLALLADKTISMVLRKRYRPITNKLYTSVSLKRKDQRKVSIN